MNCREFSFFTYRNRKQRRQICLRQRLHTAADILIDVKSNHAKLFGRTRIADRLCEVIRVVARDGTRYSYIVWMDTESKLPMRVDLLDRDGETLEQFRVGSPLFDHCAAPNLIFSAMRFAVCGGSSPTMVISALSRTLVLTVLRPNQDISSSMQTLAKANLPPLLSVPVGEKAKFSWTPTWLPQGFSEVSSSRRPLPTMDNMPIESRLYSDGLFSFSVNVNRAPIPPRTAPHNAATSEAKSS